MSGPMTEPREALAVRECPTCRGDGWVLGVEMSCCGNVLRTGECCAAVYGEANLVPEPVQEPCADPWHALAQERETP